MATETSNYKLKKIEKTDKIIDSLTDLNENADIIDEELKKINVNKADASKVESVKTYIAVYGVTTFSEIQTAVYAGKTVLLDYSGTHRLQLTYTSAEQFNFAGFVDAGNTLFNAICKSTDEWILESNTHVSGIGFTRIEVVTQYPTTEVEGVLYVKTGA